MKINEFANSKDQDGVAHYEPLLRHCIISLSAHQSLKFGYDTTLKALFLNNADVNFVFCFLVL